MLSATMTRSTCARRCSTRATWHSRIIRSTPTSTSASGISNPTAPEHERALAWSAENSDASTAQHSRLNETCTATCADVSVSNSLSGRDWELDKVPAVGDPTHIVQLGTGDRVSAGEG